jgi:hypothetical protein
LLNKAGPQTIELKSGVVEMLGAGRISLKGLIKSEVGDLSLVIDLDGNILEKQESGYYNETMSIRMSVALTSLVRCSIARLKNSTDNDFVGTLLDKAREYIPVKDEAGMEAVAADCARGSTELEMQTAHSEHVNKWIETVRNPIAKDCAGIAFTVQGAAAIGVKLGLASMKCTFSDGSRRFYMGPHLGFIAGGIGGGVMAGSFELEAKDQVIKKNGAMVVSARNMLGIPFVLIPESKGGQYQTAPGSWDTTQIDESRQVGLGFSIHASMFEAIPMIKIKKSKPDYTLLVHDLSKEILIKK